MVCLILLVYNTADRERLRVIKQKIAEYEEEQLSKLDQKYKEQDEARSAKLKTEVQRIQNLRRQSVAYKELVHLSRQSKQQPLQQDQQVKIKKLQQVVQQETEQHVQQLKQSIEKEEKTRRKQMSQDFEHMEHLKKQQVLLLAQQEQLEILRPSAEGKRSVKKKPPPVPPNKPTNLMGKVPPPPPPLPNIPPPRLTESMKQKYLLALVETMPEKQELPAVPAPAKPTTTVPTPTTTMPNAPTTTTPFEPVDNLSAIFVPQLDLPAMKRIKATPKHKTSISDAVKSAWTLFKAKCSRDNSEQDVTLPTELNRSSTSSELIEAASKLLRVNVDELAEDEI